jgi:hypothetical protein
MKQMHNAGIVVDNEELSHGLCGLL